MVIYLQRAVFMGILTIEQVLYLQVSTEISAIYLKSYFFLMAINGHDFLTLKLLMIFFSHFLLWTLTDNKTTS